MIIITTGIQFGYDKKVCEFFHNLIIIDNHYQLDKRQNPTKVGFLQMCVDRILQCPRFFDQFRHILLNCRKLD